MGLAATAFGTALRRSTHVKQFPVEGRRIANPVDICGAGDSFTAGAACALRVTHSAMEAVRFGNKIASITIM